MTAFYRSLGLQVVETPHLVQVYVGDPDDQLPPAVDLAAGGLHPAGAGGDPAMR